LTLKKKIVGLNIKIFYISKKKYYEVVRIEGLGDINYS